MTNLGRFEPPGGRNRPKLGSQALDGGASPAGSVVRVGDTVRRPRGAGAEVVEALLLHLESEGFEGAPKFLGIDEVGRQVVEFVDGEVADVPNWMHDDADNARQLHQVASLLRDLHMATKSFEPPGHAVPKRELAVPGPVWTHGDASYANLVYRAERPHALIDWEFAGPADHRHDLAGLVAMSIRGPKLGAPDAGRRERAARSAVDAVADGYGLSDSDRRSMPTMAAAIIRDAVGYWAELGRPDDELDAWSWRAEWFDLADMG